MSGQLPPFLEEDLGVLGKRRYYRGIGAVLPHSKGQWSAVVVLLGVGVMAVKVLGYQRQDQGEVFQGLVEEMALLKGVMHEGHGHVCPLFLRYWEADVSVCEYSVTGDLTKSFRVWDADEGNNNKTVCPSEEDIEDCTKREIKQRCKADKNSFLPIGQYKFTGKLVERGSSDTDNRDSCVWEGVAKMTRTPMRDANFSLLVAEPLLGVESSDLLGKYGQTFASIITELVNEGRSSLCREGSVNDGPVATITRIDEEDYQEMNEYSEYKSTKTHTGVHTHSFFLIIDENVIIFSTFAAECLEIGHERIVSEEEEDDEKLMQPRVVLVLHAAEGGRVEMVAGLVQG